MADYGAMRAGGGGEIGVAARAASLDMVPGGAFYLSG